jgi:hypothetical protein
MPPVMVTPKVTANHPAMTTNPAANATAMDATLMGGGGDRGFLRRERRRRWEVGRRR